MYIHTLPFNKEMLNIEIIEKYGKKKLCKAYFK